MWQGSAGDRRPYADLTSKPEITVENTPYQGLFIGAMFAQALRAENG